VTGNTLKPIKYQIIGGKSTKTKLITLVEMREKKNKM
jgi:hypothetical protein